MKSRNKSYKKDIALTVIKIINIVFVSFFFLCAWYTLYADTIASPFFKKGNYLIVAIFAVAFSSLAKLYGGFKIGTLRVSEIMYSQSIAVIVSNAAMYILIVLLAKRFVNPIGLLWVVLCGILWCSFWAMWANHFYFYIHSPKRTLIIYDNKMSLWTLKNINKARFNVIEKLHVDTISEKEYAFNNIECVFLCGVSSQSRNEILKTCILTNIEVYIRPHISDIILSGSKRINMCNVPVLHCAKSRPSAWFLIAKRAIDIILSLTALILLSPFMLITAMSIKLYDKGPAIYKQCRLTKDGKRFYIYKFRSMRQNAESDGKARLASQSDARITPIGKFIRAIRLDELPQLLNILKGDMSIVGPRPERPEIALQYQDELPEFALRLQVKAGLTGYAQIYGKYNTSPYDKLQMDLMYIANQSLIEDIKMMMTTIKVLFMPESTEGIKEDIDTQVKEHESTTVI